MCTCDSISQGLLALKLQCWRPHLQPVSVTSIVTSVYAACHHTNLLLLQAAANQLTTAHNAELAQLLPAFAVDHLEASVILFNFEALFLQLTQNAASLGFTDLTTPCYTGAVAGSATTAGNVSAVCDNPDSHLFWDGVHPTARSHQLWGQAVAAQLMPFASTTSSTSRKLLAKETAQEGSPLGSITVFGQPL